MLFGSCQIGGRYGIRTHGPPKGSPAFKAGALNQTLPTFQVVLEEAVGFEPTGRTFVIRLVSNQLP